MNGIKENRGMLPITDFTKGNLLLLFEHLENLLYHGTPYQGKNYSVKTFDFYLFNAFHIGDQFI